MSYFSPLLKEAPSYAKLKFKQNTCTKIAHMVRLTIQYFEVS